MKHLLLITCFMGLLLFSSCAPRLIQATPAERHASFAPYSNAKIEDKDTYRFLADRCALLIRADEVKMTEVGKRSGFFQFKNEATDGIELGTATAIDSRGYFLTAAHCIEAGPPFLAFFNDGKIQLRPSRIVWCGQVGKGEPDLALLYVTEPLDHSFAWAESFQAKQNVLAAGNGVDNPDKLAMQCEAGKILWIVEKSETLPPSIRISHDVPLRFGDSGGPLTDEKGRLIGINAILQGDFKPMKMAYVQRRGIALRPDLKWLARVIDQDQAKLHGKISPAN